MAGRGRREKIKKKKIICNFTRTFSASEEAEDKKMADRGRGTCMDRGGVGMGVGVGGGHSGW